MPLWLPVGAAGEDKRHLSVRSDRLVIQDMVSATRLRRTQVTLNSDDGTNAIWAHFVRARERNRWIEPGKEEVDGAGSLPIHGGLLLKMFAGCDTDAQRIA
jgi:hypothetical protein